MTPTGRVVSLPTGAARDAALRKWATWAREAGASDDVVADLSPNARNPRSVAKCSCKKRNPYDEDFAVIEEMHAEGDPILSQAMHGRLGSNLPSAAADVLQVASKTFGGGYAFTRAKLADALAGQKIEGRRKWSPSGADIQAGKALGLFRRRGLVVSRGRDPSRFGRPGAEEFYLSEKGERYAIADRLVRAEEAAEDGIERELARFEREAQAARKKEVRKATLKRLSLARRLVKEAAAVARKRLAKSAKARRIVYVLPHAPWSERRKCKLCSIKHRLSAHRRHAVAGRTEPGGIVPGTRKARVAVAHPRPIAMTGLRVANPLTPDVAARILREGKVRGRPLTDKQRRFFAVVAKGKLPRKLRNPAAQTPESIAAWALRATAGDRKRAVELLDGMPGAAARQARIRLLTLGNPTRKAPPSEPGFTVVSNARGLFSFVHKSERVLVRETTFKPSPTRWQVVARATASAPWREIGAFATIPPALALARRQLVTASNPSKACALGRHAWDRETGRCSRKGCAAVFDPRQGLMFGVDPTLEAEARTRESRTGQAELFHGERKNPLKLTGEELDEIERVCKRRRLTVAQVAGVKLERALAKASKAKGTRAEKALARLRELVAKHYARQRANPKCSRTTTTSRTVARNPLAALATVAFNPSKGGLVRWRDLPASIQTNKLARSAAIRTARRHGVTLDDLVVERVRVPRGASRFQIHAGDAHAVEYVVPPESKLAGFVYRHEAGDQGRGKRKTVPAAIGVDPRTGAQTFLPRRGTRLGFSDRGISG